MERYLHKKLSEVGEGGGGGGGSDPEAIKYTEQTLTEPQKTQARTNIGAGTYSKPPTGIPSTDLASAVQTSLGKADTAIQSHQDISGKEDKSNKVTSFGSTPSDDKYPSEKLVKDSLDAKQPTIDSSNKLPYSLISDTPAIPDAVEANPTVPSGTTPTDLQNLKVGSNYFAIPALPSVDNTPTKNSNNLVKSGGVYDAINPSVQSSQPAGGFAPNVVYDLGTLTGTVTFALASPTDNTIPNPYHWTFDTGSTAPTITWPSGIVWPDGFTPSVDASKHYEVLVRNGYASMLSYSLS